MTTTKPAHISDTDWEEIQRVERRFQERLAQAGVSPAMFAPPPAPPKNTRTPRPKLTPEERKARAAARTRAWRAKMKAMHPDELRRWDRERVRLARKRKRARLADLSVMIPPRLRTWRIRGAGERAKARLAAEREALTPPTTSEAGME